MHSVRLCFVAGLTLAIICFRADAASGVIFDQIGPHPGFLAGSSSSSQFNPANPNGVFATTDNAVLLSLGGPQIHITRFEAVVTGLQNFVSFDLVQSWNVQIFSSLDAAAHNVSGDVYTKTFSTPTSLTSGYSALGELASFDIDATVTPGEYWLELTMGNNAALNGTVGIRHSTIGDGPCYFAVPSSGSSIPLAAPAAYRMYGEAVPTPGVLSSIALGLLCSRRSRRV